MACRSVRLLFLFSVLTLAGCAHVEREPAADSLSREVSPYVMPAKTFDDKRGIIEQITSIFENGTPIFSYGYVERLKDSSIRGITFGRVGFTTCQDGKDLLEEYDRVRPKNRLHQFLQIMDDGYNEKITCDENVRRLMSTKPTFPQVFTSLKKDPLLRRAQDEVESRRYYRPAMLLAQKLGLKLPWSALVMYDTYIQHGEGFGEGTDIGIDQILLNTNTQFTFKTPGNGIDEVTWILEFLRQRRIVLANGDDEWKQSVDRIDDLVLIHSRDHNDELNPYLFRSKVFGKFKLPIKQ